MPRDHPTPAPDSPARRRAAEVKMVEYITTAHGIAQRLSEKWRHFAGTSDIITFCTSLFCVGVCPRISQHARRLSFSSSGFPPFSWPAVLSFHLLRVAPAVLSFCLLRVAPHSTPARAQNTLASARTDDRQTNDATCGPQAWLTGALHEGGIRSVRSTPRRAPLLATPIAKPLQCGRP